MTMIMTSLCGNPWQTLYVGDSENVSDRRMLSHDPSTQYPIFPNNLNHCLYFMLLFCRGENNSINCQFKDEKSTNWNIRLCYLALFSLYAAFKACWNGICFYPTHVITHSLIFEEMLNFARKTVVWEMIFDNNTAGSGKI